MPHFTNYAVILFMSIILIGCDLSPSMDEDYSELDDMMEILKKQSYRTKLIDGEWGETVEGLRMRISAINLNNEHPAYNYGSVELENCANRQIAVLVYKLEDVICPLVIVNVNRIAPFDSPEKVIISGKDNEKLDWSPYHFSYNRTPNSGEIEIVSLDPKQKITLNFYHGSVASNFSHQIPFTLTVAYSCRFIDKQYLKGVKSNFYREMLTSSSFYFGKEVYK